MTVDNFRAISQYWRSLSLVSDQLLHCSLHHSHLHLLRIFWLPVAVSILIPSSIEPRAPGGGERELVAGSLYFFSHHHRATVQASIR
jgi:hypothetical protein